MCIRDSDGANLQNVSSESIGRVLRPNDLRLTYVTITINYRFGARHQRRAPLLAHARDRGKNLSAILALVL